MSRGSGRTLGLSAVLVAILCFSVSSPLVKWAETPGAAVAFWRLVMAVGVWWTVVFVHRARTGLALPSRATWLRVLPAGLFFGANIATFFTVINQTSIAHAEFIGSLSPLLLLPAGAIFFGEHPNWRALRWGAVSLVGLALVLFSGDTQGEASVRGDLLMLVVMVFWVGYLLSTKWARRAEIHIIHFMACAIPFAILAAGPIAFSIAGDDIWPLSTRAWLVVALLTVLTGVAAHGLIVFAQQHLPVATIGVMQVAQPGLAVIWAWLILGEQIRAVQIPGMVLVIAGLAAFTLAGQRRAVLPLVAAQPPSLPTDG